MSDKVMYWSSVVFSALALILMLSTSLISSSNRALQPQVAQRQGAINTATNLVQLNQNLAQALADVALSKDDTAVRDLLSSQGITIRKADAPKASEAPKTSVRR